MTKPITNPKTEEAPELAPPEPEPRSRVRALLNLLPESARRPTVPETLGSIALLGIAVVLVAVLASFGQAAAGALQSLIASSARQDFDPAEPFTASIRTTNTTGMDFAYPDAVSLPEQELAIREGDVTGAVPIDSSFREFSIATVSDEAFLITDIRIADLTPEPIVTGTLIDKQHGTGGPEPRKTLYFDLAVGTASDEPGGEDYFAIGENVLTFDSATRMILALVVDGPIDDSWSWVYQFEVTGPDGGQFTYFLGADGSLRSDVIEIDDSARFRLTAKAAVDNYAVIFAEDDDGVIVKIKS
ncbi:hypothetical protein [uncultured Schumannella sp.]|uniref:hypothetical protein n=1 Tax=uncultured Schumannella sp. TaxID=1195956 RepID=UPI0025DB1108|nr:hypothetical protein [uncultured Schumannella sp.]